MAELVPAPFASLVQRICRELDREEAIFHLPRRKWWTPDADGPDLSVTFHNQPAGNPLGPAAGPQTQMAQNLVLSWLAGARIMELKTVQINDRLRIARPCIDATNIGYNIEWSQELRIAEALREYVAGSMLIHMLAHGGLLGDSPLTQTATDTIYDISLGYDLAGIRSAPIRTFVEQMRDAKSLVEHLRGEIPREFKPLRDLDYPTRISTSVTLSTFHGCPADEIERICEFLIAEMDCDVIIKMNPPMLGKERLEHLLHDVLGYDEIRVPDHAYASGLQFDESLEVCDRLTRLAVNRGRRLGAKFSNTLEVENHRDFFDSEIKTQYLSGQPLHVITLTLADAFRQAVGPSTPLTFSAGVDRFNVANMVACGFCPITTCTDLLRPGGYGRLPLYLKALTAEMNRVGASNIDAFILKGSIGVSPVEGNESPTTGSIGVSPVEGNNPPITGSIGVPPVVSSSAQMGSTPPVDSEQHHGVLKSPVTPDLGKRRRILPYWEMGDSTYILTFRVNSGLLSENERSLVLAACRYWDSKRITLHAVVVMPDHVHMLCTPLEKTKDEWWSIADLMHSIKGFTAKEINRLRGAQGSLWQREYYDRIIRSDDDYQEKWNYVVRNPQRSGLGEEYPWVWIEENDETSTSSPLVGGVSASRRSMDQSVSHRRDADAPRGGGPDDIIDAAARNLCAIAEETRSDPRYAAANNRKTPKRIDSRLETFDCITCDKCIPVCPNAANFVYSTEPESLDFHDYGVDGDALKPGPAHTIRVDRAEQIANFADFCNDCGNCDTFCPEYDGPFIKKPNFFGSHAAWSAFKTRDGFFIDTAGGGRRILGRIKGKTYRLETEQGWNGMRFEDGTVCLFLRADDHTVLRWFAFGPANTTGHVIDMTAYHTMRILLKSLLRTDHIHQVNATQS